MPKALISWTEPPLFDARTRTRTGWILRLLLLLVIFAGMMIGFHYDQHLGKRLTTLQGALISLGIAVFLMAMLEISQGGKKVSISTDSISTIGTAGFFSLGTWGLRSIHGVELVRPQEMGKPFGAMILRRKRRPVMLGIPEAVSLAKIARALHGQGVAVALSGWTPETPEDRPAPAVVPPTETTQPAFGSGYVWAKVPYSGRVLSFPHSWVRAGLAFGPAALGFALAIGAIGYHFLGPGLPKSDSIALGVWALVAMFLGAAYWDALGTLLSNRYQLWITRRVVRRRADPLVRPDDPEAIFVAVVPRENWTPWKRDFAADVGFLRVDSAAGCLLFEGANRRWHIPTDALVSCDIERVAGLRGEGDEPDGRFMVVLGARIDDKPWEAPVFARHLGLGRGLGEKSKKAARALQQSVLGILPPGRGKSSNGS